MQRLGRLLAAATTVAACAVAVPAPAAEPRSPDPDRLSARLDDVAASGTVAAIAQVRDGRDTWRGVRGTSRLGTAQPPPWGSRFRIGSITKTFLATVVLQLVEEHRLRLDDPVARWLPDAVPNGRGITVRQLLDHTSGLYDYRLTLTLPPSPGFLEYRWRTWTPQELVRRAVEQDPEPGPPPGSTFAYSNTNYLLLGEVVEAVTGRPYAREVERRVVEPLHLRHTSLPGASPWIRGPHPHGYVPIRRDGQDRLVDLTAMNPTLFGAAGEMISTIPDLERFFAALLRGRLLGPRMLGEMTTPGTEHGTYGLGLAWRDTACGIRVYGNDGDALTFQSWSFATADARHQATVVVTPDFRGDPDAAVDAFLDDAFCGR